MANTPKRPGWSRFNRVQWSLQRREKRRSGLRSGNHCCGVENDSMAVATPSSSSSATMRDGSIHMANTRRCKAVVAAVLKASGGRQW